jgi:hypothetical protein
VAQRNFVYPKSSADSRQNDNANNADENEQDVSTRNFLATIPQKMSSTMEWLATLMLMTTMKNHYNKS